MHRENLHMLLGGGVVIYALLFLASSIIAVHGFGAELWSQIGLIAFLIALLVYLARLTQAKQVIEVLPYAIAWPIIAMMLDVLYAVPLSGWGLFLDPALWVGYVLIFFVPLATVAVEEVV